MNSLSSTLFISHGAPDIILSQHPAVGAMRMLASQREKPDAIIIVSAHWIQNPVSITAGKQLTIDHDFNGFTSALYEMQYPAMGSEILSEQIHLRLQQKNIKSQLVYQQGLDHGSWVPLKIMYPQAEIPVVQISLPAGSLSDIVCLGNALSIFREENILIIGSGGSVHNLSALAYKGTTQNWVLEFENWLLESVEGNHFKKLIEADDFPEYFRMAHPGIEHYAPLVFAWAAADTQKAGKRVHHSLSYVNLGMSVFEFP